MYSFSELNTGFTILILILQTSQQLFQLDQNAQQISLNSKWYPVDSYIGTLFKYCPLSDISHIGAVQRNQTNSYLLYLGYERLTEMLLFIHYVKFHPEERKIIHIVKLNLKNEIMEEEFEFDSNDYEGKWYMQYMYYDIIQRKIILGFMSKEQKIERSLSSSRFFDQEFKFILGGSLKSFENSFQEDYLLSSFPGKMKLIFLEQNDRKEFYISNLKACESNFQALINEFYDFKSQFLQLQVDQEQENQYLIQFWVQFDEVMRQFQTIQIIRLYVKYQLDKENQIELTSFQINYLSENSKWYYCLQFYSYNYPFIFSTDQIQDFVKIYKYEIESEFLTSWHFIQVSYQNKQINYVMKNFLLNKQQINQFEKVNQFSCSRLTITLGQNDSENLLSGQIQNLKYLNCPSINTSFDNCHYSCQTCYGPNSNHCWSCDETKHRLFNPQTNTCRCKLWYLDLDEVQCHGQSEFNLIEIEIQLPLDTKYDEIQPIVQCAFGYFKYLDQCIQCPSASQKGSIQCLECLLYPNTWVYNGICFHQYQQLDMNEQNTYQYITDIISPQSNFYLLIDEELFACDNCQFCSKEEYLEQQDNVIIQCILYPLKHMNQDTYILCLDGDFDYETFKCYEEKTVKQNYGQYRGTCNQYCGYCALRTCQYCKDSSLYFSDWQGICRVCNIEHCKYCFQYNQYDLNQVSARRSPLIELQSNFEEDYIIGCSLCHSGYIFDFTINQCIKKNLQFPCINAFIKQDNELICTSSSLTALIIEEVQETIGCSTFFQFCVRCVSNNYKMVQCTKCEDGYYLNFQNGICMSCADIIEHSTKCQMLTSFYDAWKYEVMSFYNHFLPDKVPILIAGYYYRVYYIVDVCEQGYLSDYDECKIANDKNCLNWLLDNNGVVCKTCKSQSNYYQSSSFFNKKCQMCPYPCILCQERTQEEINLINPYFIVNEYTINQTYNCIKNFDSQQTYIHQKLGLIQPLNQNGTRYVNQIKKIFKQNQVTTSQAFTELEMQYFIQRNIYTFQAHYTFLTDEPFINLRNYIFSLQNQDLHYDGQNVIYHEKMIQIFNQSKVIIENLKFFNEKNILNITSKYGVEVFIKNITLTSLNIQRSLIELTNITNLTISNIQINDLIIQQSPLISINNLYQQNFQNTNLLFYDITLLNCKFINSMFLLINNYQSYVDKLLINNLRIINCTFENSSFFTFSQQSHFNKIIIKNIEICESKFIKSEFFKMPISNYIHIHQITFCNSNITQGILIQSTSSTIFQELTFQNVNLLNSTLILLRGYLSETNFDHLLYKIQIKKIQFWGQSPFKIIYRSGYNGQINIQDLILEQGNIIEEDSVQNLNISNCFFDFQSLFIQVTNFRGVNNLNFQIFCLKNFNKIIVKNCIIQQEQQTLLDQESNKHLVNKGFLFIKDFIEINLQNIQINNLYMVDSSLIYILSKYDATLNQSIIVNDFNVTNNVLVKTQLSTVPSLLYIQSEYYCNVQLTKFNYEHNIISYQIEDSQTIAPSLIFIYVKQSKISLNSGQFKQNQINNSRNSHIYLNSETITLQSLIVSDINTVDQNTELDFSIIQISSKGGLGQLIGQYILIIDVIFKNMMAHQGGCLLMVLLEKSRVLIENVIIQNSISWNNMSINSFGGSFYIDATNSELDLQLRNISVTLSISKDSGGFIYLLPSQISNKLKILNSKFINTFSQEQSLISYLCDFFLSNNTFEFKNNTILIEERFYDDFLIMNFYIPKSSDSGMIVVSNSKINIDSVSITGSYSVTIFSLSFIHHLHITNVKINKAKQFGSPFIYISNEQKYQLDQKIQSQLFLSSININNCQNMNQYMQGSFLDINLIAQITSKIKLENFQIIQNNCSNCQNGLINIQFTEYIKSINFDELLFFQNDCGFQSCLSATPIGTYNRTQIKVDHGLFIQNRGSMNGTLNLQASYLNLQNIKFINNTASKGGGYYSQNFKELQTKDIYFIENKADIGGAIYLNSTKLQSSSFSQIQFIGNKGKFAIDNLLELPIYIMLSIFQIDIETITVGGQDQPNLKKFLNENFIYLPSGQKIGQYQLFSKELNNYQNYNIQLKFYLVNNLEERIIQFENETSSCIVKQKQFIGEQQQTVEYNDLIVDYDQEDQSFNFENLIIIFDPYSLQDSYLNLQMNCQIQSKDVIEYQLNVKTFPCQVGEYYYESQCLLCEFIKGYYSLQPKASYCLKIDPKMIQKNTKNQIQLYPRYWRPFSKSSLISMCIRKPETCLGGWETGDDSCQIGSIGGLCEECDIYNIRGYGQYYQNNNFKCQYCSNFIGKTAISIVITILTLLSTYLTVNSAQLIFINFKRLKYTTVHYKIIFRQGQDQSAALIKMIVNYFQILIGIKSFQIEMYSNIIDFLNPFSNPVGSSLYSYDCFYSQQSNVPVIYINLIINLLVPIFYYLLFITVYLIVILFKKAKLSITIYFTAILYLLFYTQPQIINELGSLAAQRKISEIAYINKNVQYLYSTQTHNNWMAFCIIPLLIFEGVILPLIILFKLIKIRKQFNSDRFRKIWGYIFNDYQESSYYWEIFRIFQRQIIILTLNFNEEQIITKGCIMFVILLFYFSAVLIYKPYNVKSLNGFELDSICLCEIIIVISCLKYQTQLNQIQTIDMLLEIIFLIFFIYLLLKVSIKLITIYYYKYNERFDNIKRFLQYQFPRLRQKKSIISRFLNSKKNERNKIQQRFLQAYANLKHLKNNQSKLQLSNNQFKQSNIQNDHTIQISFQFTNNNEKNENGLVKTDYSQCQDIIL